MKIFVLFCTLIVSISAHTGKLMQAAQAPQSYFSHMNTIRKTVYSKPALVWNDKLAQSAGRYASEIVDIIKAGKGSLIHHSLSLNGKNVHQRIAETGLKLSRSSNFAGENVIVYVTDSHKDLEAGFRGYKHTKTMINSKFNSVGVAMADMLCSQATAEFKLLCFEKPKDAKLLFIVEDYAHLDVAKPKDSSEAVKPKSAQKPKLGLQERPKSKPSLASNLPGMSTPTSSDSNATVSGLKYCDEKKPIVSTSVPPVTKVPRNLTAGIDQNLGNLQKSKSGSHEHKAGGIKQPTISKKPAVSRGKPIVPTEKPIAHGSSKTICVPKNHSEIIIHLKEACPKKSANLNKS